MSRFLAGESATLQFGGALAASLQEGAAVIYLHGDLGAGKTTLCRGVLRALGHAGSVRSPTYTLVEPYQLPGIDVYHFDLYRLRDPRELEDLGIRDYLDRRALLLFEWPGRGLGHIPEADLELDIESHGEGRRVGWRASSATGSAIVTRLEKQLVRAQS